MTIQLVKEIASRMRESKSLDVNPPEHVLTLSHGYPGLVILFSTLEDLFPDEGWDIAVHHYVVKIKEELEKTRIADFSLFGGFAGYCYAVEHASKNKRRYQNLLNALNTYLFNSVNDAYLSNFQEKIALRLPVPPSFYDPISGVIGIGLVALKNRSFPLAEAFLKKTLQLCIALTREINVASYTLPGWYVPSHYQFTEIDRKFYPKGNFNLGVAHGIPGVLSFLSLAVIEDVLEAGQLEAIQKMTDWIIASRTVDQGYDLWLNRISFEAQVFKSQQESIDTNMEAWCYGTAGVSNALLLASNALKNSELKQIAKKAFLGIQKRVNIQQHFHSPTFCHGLAGLLTIAQAISQTESCMEIEAMKEEIERALLSVYSPVYPFGFRDCEGSVHYPLTIRPHHLLDSKEVPVQMKDKFGLLEGASGVLLSILAHRTGCLSWAYPFFIRG